MSEHTRRTAIVATLGPASERRSDVEGLVAAGTDVVRLAMNSGSHDWHRHVARLVREVAAEQGRGVRLMADLQARKNRVSGLDGGRADWCDGDTVVLSAPNSRCGTATARLIQPWDPAVIGPGTQVLIDDGAVVLVVTDADDRRLHCRVEQGGSVTDGRGVSLSGATLFPAGLPPRDVEDLTCAVRMGVEMVAVSFVTSVENYEEVRALAPGAAIIGKVESRPALDVVEALAATFDGLMVGRGDLGVELPLEETPFAQKRVVAACRTAGRDALVATHLLHSMQTSSRPTRAEATDVVNAVLDGATGLVLTGETGYGRYPVAAVRTLRRLIERAEEHLTRASDAGRRSLRGG